MLDKMKYVNSKGESIEFGEDIYVNYSDVRDYEWEYVSKSNRITGFKSGISKKNIPLILVKSSREELMAARDKVYQVIEHDVINKTPGKLYIGDFYLKCYLCGSKNSGYLAVRDMQTSLTLVTDSNVWIKESHCYYSAAGEQSTEGETYMDYAYDYAYDYSSSAGRVILENPGYAPAEFELIVHGPCENPQIQIAGHVYSVECQLLAGEYMKIDSANRKIYKALSSGERVNLFSKRNRESYVFEKIPPGSSVVAWDGSFGFEILLYEERSEPRWT